MENRPWGVPGGSLGGPWGVPGRSLGGPWEVPGGPWRVPGGQDGSNIAPMIQLGTDLGPSWSQLGPTWNQLGPNLGPDGPKMVPKWSPREGKIVENWMLFPFIEI